MTDFPIPDRARQELQASLSTRSGRVIEWPPGSGREARYDEGEVAIMRSFSQRLAAKHAASCSTVGTTYDLDCPRCSTWNEVTWIHEAKVELDAVVRDAPEELLPVKDVAAARVATGEAIERVDRHADDDWKVRAATVVEAIARAKSTFTADDVWERIEKPREPRALGPVMIRAKKLGLCEPTGQTVKSAIPAHHQYPMTEYRSLVYAPSDDRL